MGTSVVASRLSSPYGGGIILGSLGPLALLLAVSSDLSTRTHKHGPSNFSLNVFSDISCKILLF